MATLTHDYRDLYVYDLDEQATILDSIEAAAVRLREDPIAARAAAARAQVQAARDLHSASQVARTKTATRQSAPALDREIDVLVTKFHEGLMWISGIQVHPMRAQAADLARVAFPRGRIAHVQAPFVDQRTLNNDLMKHLQAPEHAALIAAMSLTPIVDRLAEIVPLFAECVLAGPAPSTEDIDRLSLAASEATYELIHHILGNYPASDPAMAGRRDDLLAEVRVTEARLRARYAESGRKGAATRRTTAAAAKADAAT